MQRLGGFWSGGRAVALLAAMALSACSSGRSPVTRTGNGTMYAVTADSTSFYRFGPQQTNGPDQSLPRDTLVTLIRPSFGYSKVHLVNGGGEGFVASEDIKPAPPTLLAALFPPTPDPSSDQENFDMNSSDPPPLEDLPDPDLPPIRVEPSPER